MIRAATIDESGLYRYRLERVWSPLIPRRCCFIMLNPSTADGTVDDPTIRRCIGFAKAWGFGAMSVVNLFALRATYPAQLDTAQDPVGPDNDEHIMMETSRKDCELVIAAWGAVGGNWPDRCKEVETITGRNGGLSCLGLTKDGYPRHPLYLRKNARPMPF
jgi:hypothetical protein